MLTSGDVVDLDLGLPEGREAGFRRPAVVVTAQEVLDQRPSVVQLVPLTSTLRGFGSEVVIEGPDSGLEEPSAAQCQHIRAVAVSRIGSPRGNVGSVDLRRIREVLALLLDLE
jgi:mRNA interferase MazF